MYVFDTFLKPPMQLQTSRSPRLLNGFWCILVQNEEENLLVLFLYSTVRFCWVENDENFERRKKLFPAKCFFCATPNWRSFAAGRSWALMGKMSPKCRNYAILSKVTVCDHNKVLNKQPLRFSAWLEQYKSCGAYTSPKPSLWTAYYRSSVFENLRCSQLGLVWVLE